MNLDEHGSGAAPGWVKESAPAGERSFTPFHEPTLTRPAATLSHPMGEGWGEGVFQVHGPNSHPSSDLEAPHEPAGRSWLISGTHLAARNMGLRGSAALPLSGRAELPLRFVLSARSRLARERAITARAALAQCRLCAHDCGVDRLSGPAGFCHAGSEPRVFSAQVEVSDELELIPTFALAFSGCDLRCDFCITGGPSWNPRAGEAFDVHKLAAKIRIALDRGAKTVMFLGGEPTIHLPAVLGLVAELPESAKLVWKTNAHGSTQSRELLAGIFDVCLADYKFGNDACAERLARVRNYNNVVRENLIWAAQDSDLIIRHLLMPGHIECCWRPVAEWIAATLPDVKVNLRSGFWPAWHAARHPELRGTVPARDAKRAREIAKECGLNLVN